MLDELADDLRRLFVPVPDGVSPPAVEGVSIRENVIKEMSLSLELNSKEHAPFVVTESGVLAWSSRFLEPNILDFDRSVDHTRLYKA